MGSWSAVVGPSRFVLRRRSPDRLPAVQAQTLHQKRSLAAVGDPSVKCPGPLAIPNSVIAVTFS